MNIHDRPFHNFRASKPGNRRFFCGSGTLCDGILKPLASCEKVGQDFSFDFEEIVGPFNFVPCTRKKICRKYKKVGRVVQSRHIDESFRWICCTISAARQAYRSLLTEFGRNYYAMTQGKTAANKRTMRQLLP